MLAFIRRRICRHVWRELCRHEAHKLELWPWEVEWVCERCGKREARRIGHG